MTKYSISTIHTYTYKHPQYCRTTKKHGNIRIKSEVWRGGGDTYDWYTVTDLRQGLLHYIVKYRQRQQNRDV
jgi:hypothetical protein